jgi:hypothetical protein
VPNVTQDELERELHSLREQITHLQQQQERQKKHWFRWGLVAGGIGVALAIFSAIVIVMAGGSPSPTIAALQVAGLQLIVLSAL